MKMIIVDDEISIERLFMQRFRKECRQGRVSLEFAHSAEQALQKLKKEPESINLVLSDINMPGIDGLDLLKILKENYPHMPVYIISAYGDPAKVECAKALGAQEYFTKPLDFNRLKRTLAL